MVGNAWELTWTHGDVYVASSNNSLLALGGGFSYPNDSRLATHSASPYGDRPFEGRHDIGLRLVRRDAGLSTPATGTEPSGDNAFETSGIHKWKFSDSYQSAAGTAPSTSNILAMVSIPSNTFLRAPEWNEVQIHPFDMSQYEISYEKWMTVYFWGIENGYEFDQDGCMGSMRWFDFDHSPDEPVTAIPWHDMLVWCNALSAMEGLDPVYYTNEARTVEYKSALKIRGNKLDLQELVDIKKGIKEGSLWRSDGTDCEPFLFPNWANNGYRLPTKAEFESAARGGLEKNNYSWGADGGAYTNHAWDIRNAGGTTHPVGQLQPNGYGLYDIQGNVFEASWSVSRQRDPDRDYWEDINNPKCGRYTAWQKDETVQPNREAPLRFGGFVFLVNRIGAECRGGFR